MELFIISPYINTVGIYTETELKMAKFITEELGLFAVYIML